MKRVVSSLVADRPYYSVTEAAALLGVNRVSVWRWIRAGHLPVVRLGQRTTRIRRDDLDRVLVRVGGRTKRAVWREAAAGAHHDAEHVVQFYESDDFLLDAVAEFLASALRVGGAAIALATSAHREGLERRLGAAGVDTMAARADERYVALDAAGVLARVTKDGEVDETLYNEVIGGLVGRLAARGGKVHAFGELVALLVDAGDPAGAIRLERLWNGLQRRHRFSLFCGYPMSQFGGEAFGQVLSDVCAEHSRVVPAESYSALEDPEAQLREIAVLQQQAQTLTGAVAAEREARARAEAAVRAREEFLSIAAHELKTPITTILGRAQLDLRKLRRRADAGADELRGELSETLETIVQQARRMAVLTTHLLDVSRLERGAIQLERRETDLMALVRGVVDGFGGSVDPARHPISIVGPDTLVAQVDAMRLEQVVTNLLDNAVRFSPNGGEIRVAVERVAGDDEAGCERVRIAVRDHGVGVPEAERTRIFERFHRAHALPGDAGWAMGGLGLGLYIAHQVTERHGGTIAHEAPDGPGACFVVTLPLGAADVMAASAVA